ncbi:MAG TPA: IPT/TIG domain-containing protein [Solirubrobacteraceae bacterium]|nr:IPT/TIG domain-containing protein [Solirubrobacteraceae bacterium]
MIVNGGATSAPGVFAGENATNDICEVQVRVSNANGASAPGTILPPPEGTFALTNLGTLGTTTVTATGAGFDPLAIDWADFGDPTQADSQDIDYAFVSGTELQVVAPAEAQTTDVQDVPFSVKTLGGQSNRVTALYAGVPTVSAVVNTTNGKQLDGVYGAADTGGTPIRVTGEGFSGQLVAPLQFVDTKASGTSLGTQYTFTVASDTRLTTQTVSQSVALVDVQACTVSGCSATSPADELWLFAPGNPSVSAISPTSGPAAGGTATTITGANLGCPIGVSFGSAAATTFKSVKTAGLDCGSTEKLKATSPAGTSGANVPVTVTTVESFFTGAGKSPTTATFTYK